jgi:FRG domain-containing protein
MEPTRLAVSAIMAQAARGSFEALCSVKIAILEEYGMVATYKLTTIQDAIAIATRLTKSWFRGHGQVVGNLVPRIFRRPYGDKLLMAFRPDIELATIEEFKRHATPISDRPVPASDDYLGWLCLMQHYRTPTRLLDWTENLLVALYFAVTSDGGHDGELWAMFPWALNREAGSGWGVPLVGRNPGLKFLLQQPYWAGKPAALAKSVGIKKPIQSPIAIQPLRQFARMVAHAATFTIHPSPLEGRPIVSVLPAPEHLVRYIVPAAAKSDLRAGLRALGFHDLSLFPDLEGLSRHIAFDDRVIGYGPPPPPQCSGPVDQPETTLHNNGLQPTAARRSSKKRSGRRG